MSKISDGEISLELVTTVPGNPLKSWVPAQHYQILKAHTGEPLGQILKTHTGEPIGQIDLRLGYTLDLVRYGGHIGYRIEKPFRGNHYAAKACLLLKPIAQQQGMDVLWVTCNPDNWPSRKTCEYIGAKFIEIVDLPETSDMYREGERQKCRYRWIIY